MLRYIAKKLFYGLLVLIGVVVLVFFLFQGFGDPSRLVMGQTGDAATQANIRKELYLDQPKWKQFLFYLNDISPVCIYSKEEIEQKHLKGIFIGSNKKFGLKIPYLRQSYQSRRDVGSILMQALPGTIILAVAAMLIATLIGIPLGVVAAVKQNTWLDTSAIFSSIVGISAPSFFMGIIIAYVFGFVFSHWTGLHISGNWFDIDDSTGARRLTLQNLILPAVTLGIRPLAIITQLTRSAMLD
ncbi:MAG TPA: ABC transporter permease, partial [Chitinophagaceae bacterium]|nr:ABC transporter permease [Chitinophagaceae bacterium]